MDILNIILANKRDEVATSKKKQNLEVIKALALAQTPTRDFINAITTRTAAAKVAVIAEIKRASPSKGLIRADFKPDEIAKSYEASGAACLSVVTDDKYFQGCAEFLVAAREASTLPVLRKDFIVDAYQIYESRAMGADCILLIAAVLTLPQMLELENIAHSLGMAAIVEVHDGLQLALALQLKTPLIGINNRDLHTLNVTLNTTVNLVDRIPKDKIVITKSGIFTRQDVELMRRKNVGVFLVGEALLSQEEPGQALANIFN